MKPIQEAKRAKRRAHNWIVESVLFVLNGSRDIIVDSANDTIGFAKEQVEDIDRMVKEI